MAFGVTPVGFVRKRLEDILDEKNKKARSLFGKEINLGPEEPLGQWIGSESEREADLWEILEDVYNSPFPDLSDGITLINSASIVGVTKKTPSPSTISGQLFFGTIGTVIPVLPQIEIKVINSVDSRFKLLTEVTLVAGLNEKQKISFDNNPDSGAFDFTFRFITVNILFDDSLVQIQAKLDSAYGTNNIIVTGAITSAAGLTFEYNNPGPLGFGLRSIELGVLSNVTLQEIATPTNTTIAETIAGVPQGEADLQAIVDGSTDGPSGTLTEIITPITGWDSTVNPLDAVLGQDEETDAEFRLRRKQEVARAGSATIPGIFSDLIKINDVTTVIVFQNNLDIVDLDGRLPHSVDIVIEGGDEDEIADEVFKTVGGGITMLGDIVKVVKGPSNFDHTVKFSRADNIEIFLEIDLEVDIDLFPVNGEAQVKALILIYGNALQVSQDVVIRGTDPALSCSFDTVPGILNFDIRIGIAASPTLDDNIIIQPRERSKWDSSRIDVVTI